MLRGRAMSEQVRRQALSTVECDIPDRLSIAEYRRVRPKRTPEAASLLYRLRALRQAL
jgi:hypothetical protein